MIEEELFGLAPSDPDLAEDSGGFPSLEELVTDRAAAKALEPGATIVCWRELEEEEARRELVRLAGWVRWFAVRYALTADTVPPCWDRHPALVEELAALRSAWEASFSPDDAGHGPIGWHERMWLALTRIRSWYRGECSSGHIAPYAPAPPLIAGEADEAAPGG